MKVPVTPPDYDDLFQRILAEGSGLHAFKELVGSGIGPVIDGKYRHWDILRQLAPPEGWTHEAWWFAIKSARRQAYLSLPVADKRQAPFKYALVDPLLAMLHRIDKDAGGAIQGHEQITNPALKDTYIIKSLMEEAITSSQLEGAATTRAVAKEMIQSGRAPANRSEQMIYSNYQAMLFIRRLGSEPLTPGIVRELHRIVTRDAMDDVEAAGRLRRTEDEILIVDQGGTVLHVPPDAAELAERMERMCVFANDTSGSPFLHPAIRSIVLHFWLAYDHPFVDGNGRTARALFYWSMARHGYWLCEFISISRILQKAPARYGRAFLYSESDDNDATYFILNQLDVIIRAIQDLHEYLQRKAAELQDVQQLFSGSRLIGAMFNHRQLALLNHALKHPHQVYTFESHRRSHGTSYQTARTDLLQLARNGVLDTLKVGRTFTFLSPEDLRERIALLGRDGARRKRAGR